MLKQKPKVRKRHSLPFLQPHAMSNPLGRRAPRGSESRSLSYFILENVVLITTPVHSPLQDRPSVDAILRLAYVRQHVERYAQHVIALSPLSQPPELGVEIRSTATAAAATGTPTSSSASGAGDGPGKANSKPDR